MKWKGKRHCPTPKKDKHFNEAWAKIAAEKQAEKYGGNFKGYHCPCGWWHTLDRQKARAVDNARESRSARRIRAKRGQPPPFAHRVAERERERRERERDRKTARNRRQRLARQIPIRVWEDDGGAYFGPRDTSTTEQ
jgi:hypothetical protein